MDEKQNVVEKRSGNRSVKLLKYFFVFLIFFAVFFAILAYNIHHMVTGFMDSFRVLTKIPATVIARHPLHDDADEFVKYRKDFDTQDQKNAFMNDVEKSIDGKYAFDEAAQNGIWKKYSELRRNLEELAAKEPLATEAVSFDIPDKLFHGEMKLFFFPTLIDRAKISALMASIAIGRKQYYKAIAVDLGLIRVARAVAIATCDVPSLIGVLMQYQVAKLAEKGPAKIYLESDDAFRDPETLAAIKKALKIRTDSIPLFYDIRVAMQVECAWSMALLSVIRAEYPFTMAVLDLWYEKPENFPAGIVKLIKPASMNGGAALLKSASDHLDRFIFKGKPSFWGEYTGNLNLHPLFSSFAFSNFPKLIADVVRSDASNRLVTLGALARVFYFENGKWPDLKNDKEFKVSAGMAAIDPADGNTMCFKQNADLTMSFYSVGPDGIDNGGDETDDVVIIVKPLQISVK